MDHGRQHSLAHLASARLNTLAAKGAALSIALKARRGAKALVGCRISGPVGPDNRLRRLLNRPWNKLAAWDRTPLGLENRRSLSTARCAGRGGIGKTLESPNSKVPALHREAERDTTGSISRQPPVHTWIAACVQGNAIVPREASPSSNTPAYSPQLR